jgi:hypothetical protein
MKCNFKFELVLPDRYLTISKSRKFRSQWWSKDGIYLLSDNLDDAIREVKADSLLKKSNFDIWRFPGASLVYSQ